MKKILRETQKIMENPWVWRAALNTSRGRAIYTVTDYRAICLFETSSLVKGSAVLSIGAIRAIGTGPPLLRGPQNI